MQRKRSGNPNPDSSPEKKKRKLETSNSPTLPEPEKSPLTPPGNFSKFPTDMMDNILFDFTQEELFNIDTVSKFFYDRYASPKSTFFQKANKKTDYKKINFNKELYFAKNKSVYQNYYLFNDGSMALTFNTEIHLISYPDYQPVHFQSDRLLNKIHSLTKLPNGNLACAAEHGLLIWDYKKPAKPKKFLGLSWNLKILYLAALENNDIVAANENGDLFIYHCEDEYNKCTVYTKSSAFGTIKNLRVNKNFITIIHTGAVHIWNIKNNQSKTILFADVKEKIVNALSASTIKANSLGSHENLSVSNEIESEFTYNYCQDNSDLRLPPNYLAITFDDSVYLLNTKSKDLAPVLLGPMYDVQIKILHGDLAVLIHENNNIRLCFGWDEKTNTFTKSAQFQPKCTKKEEVALEENLYFFSNGNVFHINKAGDAVIFDIHTKETTSLPLTANITTMLKTINIKIHIEDWTKHCFYKILSGDSLLVGYRNQLFICNTLTGEIINNFTALNLDKHSGDFPTIIELKNGNLFISCKRETMTNNYSASICQFAKLTPNAANTLMNKKDQLPPPKLSI